MSFRLLNGRHPYEFRYYRGDDPLAVSGAVAPAAEAPAQGHLFLVGSSVVGVRGGYLVLVDRAVVGIFGGYLVLVDRAVMGVEGATSSW